MRRTIVALAMTLLCVAATPTWARQSRPIVASGTVEFVDHDTLSLVFKAAKDKKPLVLGWNKDTDFVKDGQAVTAAQLKDGDVVSIHYRRPLFGQPWLTKVLWSTDSKH